MGKVHDIFNPSLGVMSGDVPDRPLQPPHKGNPPVEFNEYDYSIVHDVMGNDRLAKPMQALLEQLAVFEMTDRSFGADRSRAFEIVLPLLRDLRQACKDEWEDIR